MGAHPYVPMYLLRWDAWRQNKNGIQSCGYENLRVCREWPERMDERGSRGHLFVDCSIEYAMLFAFQRLIVHM